MNKFLPLIFLPLFCLSCHTQNEITQEEKSSPKLLVGGGCDGCELMYEGMPQHITSVDTSAGWFEQGQKLLITGKVYQLDGKTPAPNVIIYYWQTDNKGYYSQTKGMNKKAERHGHIRSWVKSDENGNYAIYTIRPAPYPNRDFAAHIHLSIKEPNIEEEYYTDALVFDDDKLLTSTERKKMENRGGSGVLRPVAVGDLHVVEHNVILGLNIPNYPSRLSNVIKSGLSIGEDSPSFTPFHAWGPDKGSKACPVCKYGRFHGILYFVNQEADWKEVKNWLRFLEKESEQREGRLKVYFVYTNSKNYSFEKRQQELAAIGKELSIQKLALTFVPSTNDITSEIHLNKINPKTKNTFIVYRQRSIIDKYINLDATVENFAIISNLLDETISPYFDYLETWELKEGHE